MPLRVAPVHRRRQVRREIERRVHEGEMRERLRKVAELPLVPGVVLLGHQAEVVAESHEPREELMRLVVATEQFVAVAEPEGAREKDALARRQPVDSRLVRAVAEDEAVLQQLPLDGFDRAADARVCCGQKADEGQEQKTCVQLG